jgi:hypothetical protein
MVGFPHSEIIGSKLIRSSPTLIAAYYVLHRLCTPRHPLNALKTLDRSHYQCPQRQQHPTLLKWNVSIVGIVDPPHRCSGFDRSDQINQISRGILVPPRGAGQTEQKAISLRCRKIRTLLTEVANIQTCSLDLTRCVPDQNPIVAKPRSKVPIQTDVWWWSLTGSNRRHPACKAGALPAELRPQSF